MLDAGRLQEAKVADELVGSADEARAVDLVDPRWGRVTELRPLWRASGWRRPVPRVVVQDARPAAAVREGESAFETRRGPEVQDLTAGSRVATVGHPQRVPPVAEEGGAPAGGGPVPAHPHGHRGRRLNDVQPLTRRPHGAEELVGEPAAVLVGADAQRLELAPQVPDADAEDQAVAREAPDRPHRRRHLQRVPVRRHEYVGAEPQSGRASQAPGARRQRLQERRPEVDGDGVVGNGDVVGEPDRVESELLGAGQELVDRA